MYNLNLDNEGFVNINRLINSLRKERKWKNLNEEDLQVMIDSSKEKVFEIKNDRIRVLSGRFKQVSF